MDEWVGEEEKKEGEDKVGGGGGGRGVIVSSVVRGTWSALMRFLARKMSTLSTL